MTENANLSARRHGVVMPLIRCTCACGKVWDVAFVPWSLRPQDAFKCLWCQQWCESVRLFRDGDVLSETINECHCNAQPPAACECGCTDVVCAECGEQKTDAR